MYIACKSLFIWGIIGRSKLIIYFELFTLVSLVYAMEINSWLLVLSFNLCIFGGAWYLVKERDFCEI